MKVNTSCGVVAILAAVTGSAFAQDLRLSPPSTSPATSVTSSRASAALIAMATPENRVAATGGPSPMGYLAVGSGAALLGCVWLSRRYRADG